MSPGDITNLGLSDEVAFRVEFEGRPPRANDLYWRGPSLTHFNGRTWSMLQGDAPRRARGRHDRVSRRADELSRHARAERPQLGCSRSTCRARWTGDNSLRMGSDYQLGTFFGGPRRAQARLPASRRTWTTARASR